MSRRKYIIALFWLILAVGGVMFAITLRSGWTEEKPIWSAGEKAVLRTLWIGSLPALPVDPSNKFSDNPDAARLGKKIFFDTRFSGNKKVSCGTCHMADYTFTDTLPLAHGMGTTSRRSMPLVGVAYNTWFFWDGRKDSLWAQALGPIESPVEHGFTRTMCAFVIHRYYRTEYEAIFGALPEFTEQSWPSIARPATDDPDALKAWVVLTPDAREEVNRIYVNMGKAIGAYVRTIVPGAAPFDRYVEGVLKSNSRAMEESLSRDQVAGLKLFIGKGQCINCHNGPLFTNGGFHNIGVPGRKHLAPDQGRAEGIVHVLLDEFNCLSRHSDAEPGECQELRFLDTKTGKYVGAFKTPSLRNVAERPPYMNAGQFPTLSEVLEFYRSAKSPELNHSELSDRELAQLKKFLEALSGPIMSLQ